MTERQQPPEGAEDPRNPEMQALQQEVDLLRKDMEKQKTALDGRLDVQDEKISGLTRIVYGILVTLIVGVAVAFVIRAAGLG